MIARERNPLLRTFKVVGQKEVFLPNIQITLLRTPRLSPYYAKFRVPLNINKLDLKDYLYHAYKIKAQHIRSAIVPQAVKQNSPRDTRPAPRRWFKPQSLKYMTVEMDQPFVWPPEPTDYTPWDRDTYEAANDLQQTEQDKLMPDAKAALPEDASTIRQHAKRLLSGKEKWRSGAQDVRMFSRTLTARRGNNKGVAVLEERRT